MEIVKAAIILIFDVPVLYLFCSLIIWLNIDIDLPLAGMNKPIQTRYGLKPGFYRSIFWDVGGRSKSTDMNKAAIIFDVSVLSLIYRLIMVIQRHSFASSRNG